MTAIPTHAIIQGEYFEYAEKMPYTTSGAGDFGVLRYDEATDRLQCHECGKWSRALGSHVSRSHRITTREYKVKHGLKIKTKLCGRRLIEYYQQRQQRADFVRFTAESARKGSAARLANVQQRGADGYAKSGYGAEWQNVNNRCHAQIMASFYSLKDRLGRTPTVAEMTRSFHISIETIKRRFPVNTYNEFVEFCGSIPRKVGRFHRLGQTALVELARDYYVKRGRLPNTTDAGRGGFPNYRIITREFGSWRNFLKAAGLAVVAEKQGGIA